MQIKIPVLPKYQFYQMSCYVEELTFILTDGHSHQWKDQYIDQHMYAELFTVKMVIEVIFVVMCLLVSQGKKIISSENEVICWNVTGAKHINSLFI